MFYNPFKGKELNRIIGKCVFKLVAAFNANGHRSNFCSFVDRVKELRTEPAYAKSGFVVQAFNDKKDGLLTGCPTIQRFSQSLLLKISITLTD